MFAIRKYLLRGELVLLLGLCGCGLMDQLKSLTAAAPSSSPPPSSQARPSDSTGERLTFPPSDYSTEKGRSLAERYNRNLDEMLGMIVQDHSTRALQFAPASFSIRSIGFFGHSGSKSPDDRYLEVIVAVPDLFDETTDLNAKLDYLFGRYSPALLSILSSDANIFNDKEVAGYGVNFSWRTMMGSSVRLERAVVYVGKEESRKFSDEEMTRQELLGNAVIYAFQGENNPKRMQYSAPIKPFAPPEAESPAEVKPGRAEIREAEITPATAMKEAEAAPLPTPVAEPARITAPAPVPPAEELKVAEALVKRKEPAETNRAVNRQRLQGFAVELSLPLEADAERLSSLLRSEQPALPINVAEEEKAVRFRAGSFKSYSDAEKLMNRLRRENLEGRIVYIF